jgi:hypothetical protein
VVPHGSLNNIALIPTIKEDAIAAQKTDVIMEAHPMKVGVG